MANNPAQTLTKHFASLPDPRTGNATPHVLLDILKDLFDGCQAAKFMHVPHSHARIVEKGHGRIEIRECRTLSDLEFLEYVQQRHHWGGLQTVVMVCAERRVKDKRSRSIRYSISSPVNDAKRILQSIRQHGEMENKVH